MTIRIMVGNVGSGKTASMVKEMLDNSRLHYYTNIKTDLKNCTLINSSMICKKELLGTTKSGKENYRFTLNLDYWKRLKGSVNVVLDEAHEIINARRSMSKPTQVILSWLALLRRVLGGNSRNYGDLILITQVPERLDVIAREMSRNIAAFRCHYVKTCADCGCYWREHSDVAEEVKLCPTCGSDGIDKTDFVVQVKYFTSISRFEDFRFLGAKAWYKERVISDINKSFVHYDTLQWDNLFSDLYA